MQIRKTLKPHATLFNLHTKLLLLFLNLSAWQHFIGRLDKSVWQVVRLKTFLILNPLIYLGKETTSESISNLNSSSLLTP